MSGFSTRKLPFLSIFVAVTMVLFLLSEVKPGSALKCYHCVCLSDCTKHNDLTRNCPKNNDLCVTHKDKSGSVLRKGCMKKGTPKDNQVMVCSKDLCNNAGKTSGRAGVGPSTTPSTGLMLLPIVAVVTAVVSPIWVPRFLQSSG